MFSKNTYFLPQVSSQPRIPAHHEILFHEFPEMISGHYISPNIAPSFVETATFFDQDISGINVNPNCVNTFQRKRTVKKDRHSKILTAQGPRDRRVRLSIGIARKFFDLQEMLGFDKPSKTLDWLLNKSKAAIKELVQMKEKATVSGKSRISSPSECEVASAEACENGNSDSKRKSCKGKDPEHSASNLAKESRAKARARARERTREKMCIKQLNGAKNTTFDQIPYRVLNNTGNREGMINYPLTNEAAVNDLIQESTVIKRKQMMTKHPAFFGFQQNIFVSKDLSSNYTTPSANATDNWDICAVLDQYKFINSTSNI